jgi:hypothetical protein
VEKKHNQGVSFSALNQPFVIQTDDGAWLCCVTTGPGHESVQGQHVTTTRSTDQGRTWSDPVPVEPYAQIGPHSASPSSR